MKICFPVRSNDGLESVVFRHFGLAPQLLIVDTDSRQVTEFDPQLLCDVAGPKRFELLTDQEQVSAVVVIEIGQGACLNLQETGIKVFQAAEGSIAANSELLLNNNLKEMKAEEINMNGQGRGMGRGQGQGRGLNCRAAGAGRGMGRKQSMGRGQCVAAGQGQAFGQGQALGQGFGRKQMAEFEVVEPGMGRGRGQGMNAGQRQGLGRGMGRSNGMGFGA